MPTITRTETSGQVFFDNSAKNQRDMNQLVQTAYMRYAAFDNKLIVTGVGNYNHFNAQSDLYMNKRGVLLWKYYFGKLSR